MIFNMPWAEGSGGGTEGGSGWGYGIDEGCGNPSGNGGYPYRLDCYEEQGKFVGHGTVSGIGNRSGCGSITNEYRYMKPSYGDGEGTARGSGYARGTGNGTERRRGN